MTNGTLFLPGFHLPTLRRTPRSAAHRLADEKAKVLRHTITQLGQCFGSFIPVRELGNEPGGDFSRRRIFSKENTFWGFFTQVLDADGGCQEVVRKFQTFAAARSMPVPSASTSAYCQARGKLERSGLQRMGRTTNTLDAASRITALTDGANGALNQAYEYDALDRLNRVGNALGTQETAHSRTTAIGLGG